MASIRKAKRKRLERWIVDYRDVYGKRHHILCRTKQEAEHIAADKEGLRGGGFSRLAGQWVQIIGATVKPATLRTYNCMLRIHILPELGHRNVKTLYRSDLKAFLANKVSQGLSPKTCILLYSVLYGILDLAVEDRILQSNPASRLPQKLGLSRVRGPNDKIKAFTETELETFLLGARAQPRLYPLFLTMARTGIRIGEALALQWPAVNFDSRQLHIKTSAGKDGVIGTTKTGKERHVDMSAGLTEALKRLRAERNEDKLRHGWQEMPPWVFCQTSGEAYTGRLVQLRFKKILTAASLSDHFTPHSLRHTFATLHIRRGTPITYIKDQLGHSSIQMTVDLYGSWFPTSDLAAADGLDTLIIT